MEKIQNINDVCKEVLTILAYADNDFIEQIPDAVFKNLQEFAADSKVDFFINTESDLNDQEHEKYNPNNLFKKVLKQENKNIDVLENALKQYKESFWTKFKNFISKILHINS